MSIRHPTSGADFSAGRAVTFEGGARDEEDGELTGDALVWESDEDGELGTGTTTTAEDLSVASHTISLTATDSEGATAEASVSIRVRRGDLDVVLANEHVGCGACTPRRGESTIWMNEGGGTFTRTDSILPETGSHAVALGDLDGDDDLDAFIANGFLVGTSEQARPNSVWMNDGTGTFADSGQRIGRGSGADSRDVALGDVDGDGDLDAVVANRDGLSRLYENDGSGTMSLGEEFFLSDDAEAVALGDLDRDGDVDVVLVRFSGRNRVFINGGLGSFERGRSFGGLEAPNTGVDLADLDGDGDLDAVDVLGNDPDRVWMNDGTGDLVAENDGPAQELGEAGTTDVALGDVDVDGDPDAFLTKVEAPDQVWLNDGSGRLDDSGQRLGGATDSEVVALGDVDGDAALDAYVGIGGGLDLLFLNDGAGSFTDSEQPLGHGLNVGVALGDLDGS